MKHQKLRVLAIIMLVIALSAVGAHAADLSTFRGTRTTVSKPGLTFDGTIASCKSTIIASGQTINATLELWQGSTLVASWSDCKTGIVSLSGTATVTSGLTYTLTVSGTINGVAFTPQSVTKTP